MIMTMICPITWYVLAACHRYVRMRTRLKANMWRHWFIAKLRFVFVFVLTRLKASVRSLLSQAWGWFICKVGQRKGRQPECSEFKALQNESSELLEKLTLVFTDDAEYDDGDDDDYDDDVIVGMMMTDLDDDADDVICILLWWPVWTLLEVWLAQRYKFAQTICICICSFLTICICVCNFMTLCICICDFLTICICVCDFLTICICDFLS